jgi:hypothetical protein
MSNHPRLWEYLEGRMPGDSSGARTVGCKFAVPTARMLIEEEKRLTTIDEVDQWLRWLRAKREGKIQGRVILASDEEYGIEAWKREFLDGGQ